MSKDSMDVTDVGTSLGDEEVRLAAERATISQEGASAEESPVGEALSEELLTSPQEAAIPEVAGEELPAEETNEEVPPPQELSLDTPPSAETEMPSKAPWWRRILTGQRGESAGLKDLQPLEAEALSPEGGSSATDDGVAAEKTASPDEVAEAFPSGGEVRPQGGRALIGEAYPDEKVPEDRLPEEGAASEQAVAAPPSFTLDDVRLIVQEELARQQADRYRAARLALQEISHEMSAASIESLQTELTVLSETEQSTLQNPNLPPEKQRALLDMIRERRIKLERQIADMDTAAAERMAEADLALAELGGHGIVAGLRQEVDRQKETLARIEAQGSKGQGAQLSLVPTLLLLLLLAAVGVAGILLPRQAGTDVRLQVDTAALLQASGKTNDAILALDDAVRAGIEDAPTLGRVGEMYRSLDQHQKAIEVLVRAVEQEPRSETYLLSLARSYGSAGRLRDAIAQYEALIDLDPDNLWYPLEMAHHLFRLREYDQALANYQKVEEMDPDFWQGYYYQAEVLREQLAHDEAIALYRRTLEVDPGNYWALVGLGASYAGKGEYAQAIDHYEMAIEVDPDRPAVYYYLGEAYRALGQFEQALGPYQDAIERDYAFPLAYIGLGRSYIALDDCPSAIIQFKEALEMDPNNVEAQEGLAACQEE